MNIPIELIETDKGLVSKLIKEHPRMGVKALLVLTGVKPGDVVNHCSTQAKDHLRSIANGLDSGLALSSIEFTEGDDHKLVLFNELISPELVDKIESMFREHSDNIPLLRKFHSYPQCCSIAYMNGKSVGHKPFTEHKWCSNDCAYSIKLADLYKQAVRLNAPDSMKTLENIYK